MTRAFVVNGSLITEDTHTSNEKRACAATLRRESARALVAVSRMRGSDVLLVLNTNDPHGGPMMRLFMPLMKGNPTAIGEAERAPVYEVLSMFDKEAAHQLNIAVAPPILVVDHGVAEVFVFATELEVH